MSMEDGKVHEPSDALHSLIVQPGTSIALAAIALSGMARIVFTALGSLPAVDPKIRRTSWTVFV